MSDQRRKPDQPNPPSAPSTNTTDTESQDSTPRSHGLNRRAFLTSTAGVALGASMGVMGWTGCDNGKAPTEATGDAGPGDLGPPELTPEQLAQQKRDAICKPVLTDDKGVAITFAPDAITQDDKLFSFGVQAGVITANSALLWCHATDKAAKSLRVWRGADEQGKVTQVTEVEATPDADGFFHIPVKDLAAGATYQYAFFDAKDPKQRSRIGTFKTAFREDCLQPITVAATACTHVGRFPVLKSLQYMAKQSPDIFCHMGDMTYNDGAKTKAEYHDKWRTSLQAPGYPEIFASAGIYGTWDDHETTDNSDLYKLPPEHRQIARDAYRTHIAQPRHADGHFWDSYRWGATAEFFVLDCRGEREGTNYISPKQMEWLKKALKDSPCHFKVVLNSVPIIALPPVWTLVKGDRWEGYPRQRDELLDHITGQKIDNVWFLGGDYHVGLIAKVEKEGPRSKMYEILVGPGGNRLPDAFIKLLGENEENAGQFAPKDQFDYFKPKVAATLLTFDPVANNVHVRFVDPETEEVLFDQKLSQASS